MLIADGEVFKAARLIVDRHGARAADYAQDQIDQLTAQGDEIGAEAWRQIAAAVAEVQRQTRRPDEYIN
jgi:hypothetical protein